MAVGVAAGIGVGIILAIGYPAAAFGGEGRQCAGERYVGSCAGIDV